MKLTSYDAVCVPMPPKGVSEEEVRRGVNEIVSRIPCFEDSPDAPITQSDKAKVRLALRENGQVLGGLDGALVTVSLADGFYPKPLTDALLGMAGGQSKHVEWKGASVGAADEADESADFEADVEVVSVRRRVRPEMSDAWVAAHVPRCSTVEELFDDVRGRLSKDADAAWDAMLRERCAAVLGLRLEGEPSAEDAARAVEGVRANFERACAREGKTSAQKASELGLSEEHLPSMFEQQGALVARQGIAVRLMADYLGVQASDEAVRRAARSDFPDEASLNAALAHPETRAKFAEVARCEAALSEVAARAVVIDEPERAAGGAPARQRPNPFA